MTRFYTATVQLFFEAGDHPEDALSGFLTEQGIYDQEQILDWKYVEGPTPVITEKTGREEFFADDFIEANRRKPEDPWAAAEDYPVEQWQHEVAEDNTRLGYWEWVQHQRRMNDEA